MKSFLQFISEDHYRQTGFYLPRMSMPQIRDTGKFELWIEKQGYKTKRLMVVSSVVKPTQSDFDRSKVDKLIGIDQETPVVTDEDYHILDGHHRHLANLRNDDETWIMTVNTSINQLLKLAYEYKELFSDG